MKTNSSFYRIHSPAVNTLQYLQERFYFVLANNFHVSRLWEHLTYFGLCYRIQK